MTAHTELRKVRDVMHADPTTVSSDTSVDDIVQIFAERGFEALPVVDEGGSLVGIVTKLDVLRGLRPSGTGRRADVYPPVGAQAMNIMRPGVVTLEADDPVVAAVDLMLETRFNSLPVVTRARGHRPRVVGMVSRGDLVRALLQDHP